MESILKNIDIKIRENKFIIQFFSDVYYWEDKKTKLNKKEYAIELLKNANVLLVMEDDIQIEPIEEINNPWFIIFTIRDKYLKYFNESKTFNPYRI